MRNILNIIGSILMISLGLLGIIGWVLSIVKLTRTDFKAPYKAEVVYGIGVFTGAGAIIGYINIQD